LIVVLILVPHFQFRLWQSTSSDMSSDTTLKSRERAGRRISIGIVIATLAVGLIVLYQTTHHPRTDDATVFANYIGIAPQVEGPLVHLNVYNNQLVEKGELLFEIDARPYKYALETALSEQAALEGEIADEGRRIAALKSAVAVSAANIQSAEADVSRYEAAIDQAQADVANAGQGVSRAEAEWTYSSNNLQRLEPLLAKQFVTVDQVDQARTSEMSRQEALKQAESQLLLAEAGSRSAAAQHKQSQAALEQSKALHEESANAVTTLEPLISQRGAREAAVERARYDLDNCRVYAPFEARVTNLKISEGAYAKVGQQICVLIDVRRWWAIANFREGQLPHINRGTRADVYLVSKPDRHFSGVVESISFGVTPDPDLIGSFDNGLPDVQRTLNWVHLASRYPVWIRVENPDSELFRVSESAVVIIRGH
jgi:multidrug efflux system membrane fusion protein